MASGLAAAVIANNSGNGVLACSTLNGQSWSANTGIGQASNGTAPSLAVFNNMLYVAFVANNSTRTVLVCSSQDGVHWSGATNIGETSQSAPSLAVFNNKLWLAFVADNATNTLLVCSTSDGSHWTPNTSIGEASNGTAPSLAVFNNMLYVAFVANNSTRTVLVCSSQDGVHWSGATNIGETSQSAPSLAVFNNKLWLAFIADNGTNTVLVCSSADGAHWTLNTNIGETSQSAPSLAVYYNMLWLAFVSNDSTRTVLVCGSSDGTHWTSNASVGETSQSPPALTAFDFYPGSLGVFVPEQSALFFADVGSLAALGFDQAAGRWLWTDHGTPPGTTVAGGPGALLNSADAGLKFFMTTANGHVFEHEWSGSAWAWTDHGTPPGASAVGVPGCTLDAPGSVGTSVGIAFFVAGSNGHLFENYWNQTEGWLWTDHGAPPGTAVASSPGALLNSADAGLKVFVTAANGHVFERSWNGTAWTWADHGTPPGASAVGVPGCALDAPGSVGTSVGIAFFVAGSNGHLFENYWNQTEGWLWTDHGAPPGTAVASSPGALLNSADAGLKFFMTTGNGHVFERSWNGSAWAWADHGEPPGASVVGAPGCALDAPGGLGIAFFVAGSNGHLFENYWNQTEGWLWTDVGMPVLAIYSSGLIGGWNNYVIYSNCNPILGLTVTVNVTEDIICASASGPTTGFSFQLNAYSAAGKYIGWQQYGISLCDLEGYGLDALVNNWYSEELEIQLLELLARMPTYATVPAGYALSIALQNDASGNITGVTCTVTDNNGNNIGSRTLDISSYPGVTASEYAPITGFEFLLVGPCNGESATLSSGAGTITYTASTPLAVVDGSAMATGYWPPCFGSTNSTGENANSSYGALSEYSPDTFVQAFGVAAGPSGQTRPGTTRLNMVIPPAKSSGASQS